MKQATNSLRDNSDIIYLFKTDDVDQLDDFRKSFCGELDKKTFTDMVKSCWKEQYGYLKIDRRDTMKTQYFSKHGQLTPNEDKSMTRKRKH
jgi:hypothetical protein